MQPQIPIWIGAQEAPSVRRAGRLADAWYVPPFPTHAKLVDLYALYLEERERRAANGSAAIPVRRELYLADTVAEAQAAVSAGAASRYATYSSWGLDVDSALDQRRWRESRFLLGDPATVAERLLELAEDVDVLASGLQTPVAWAGSQRLDGPDGALRHGAAPAAAVGLDSLFMIMIR